MNYFGVKTSKILFESKLRDELINKLIKLKKFLKE